jgi:hypothetical protein
MTRFQWTWTLPLLLTGCQADLCSGRFQCGHQPSLWEPGCPAVLGSLAPQSIDSTPTAPPKAQPTEASRRETPIRVPTVMSEDPGFPDAVATFRTRVIEREDR